MGVFHAVFLQFAARRKYGVTMMTERAPPEGRNGRLPTVRCRGATHRGGDRGGRQAGWQVATDVDREVTDKAVIRVRDPERGRAELRRAHAKSGGGRGRHHRHAVRLPLSGPTPSTGDVARAVRRPLRSNDISCDTQR